MESIKIFDDIRNACTYIINIDDHKLYKIDNKELYIRKCSTYGHYRYDIISYNVIVGVVDIDIDNNDNIRNIRYSYCTYKYSRTTTKHIRYMYKILNCLALINDCKLECDTFYRNIAKASKRGDI